MFVYGANLIFQVKQIKFREMFRTSAPFSYKAVHPYISLDKVGGNYCIKIMQYQTVYFQYQMSWAFLFQLEKAIRDMERELAGLQESTNLFDVTTPDYRDLKLCRRDIAVLKELWDIVAFVQVSG